MGVCLHNAKSHPFPVEPIPHRHPGRGFSPSESEVRKASDPGPIRVWFQAHPWVPGRKDRNRPRAASGRCLTPGMTNREMMPCLVTPMPGMTNGEMTPCLATPMPGMTNGDKSTLLAELDLYPPFLHSGAHWRYFACDKSIHDLKNHSISNTLCLNHQRPKETTL